jgi:hypothetical protein
MDQRRPAAWPEDEKFGCGRQTQLPQAARRIGGKLQSLSSIRLYYPIRCQTRDSFTRELYSVGPEVNLLSMTKTLLVPVLTFAIGAMGQQPAKQQEPMPPGPNPNSQYRLGPDSKARYAALIICRVKRILARSTRTGFMCRRSMTHPCRPR